MTRKDCYIAIFQIMEKLTKVQARSLKGGRSKKNDLNLTPDERGMLSQARTNLNSLLESLDSTPEEAFVNVAVDPDPANDTPNVPPVEVVTLPGKPGVALDDQDTVDDGSEEPQEDFSPEETEDPDTGETKPFGRGRGSFTKLPGSKK